MLMQYDKLHKFLFHQYALFNRYVWMLNNRCQIHRTCSKVRAKTNINYQINDRYDQKDLDEQPFDKQCNAK